MKSSQKSQRAESTGEERIRRFAEIETLILGREVHVREARRPTAELGDEGLEESGPHTP